MHRHITLFHKKYPRLSRFFKNRISKEEACGLFFSLKFGLALFVFFLFLGLAQGVIDQDSLIMADAVIMSLVINLRDIETAKFFLFFTYLGNFQTVISLGAIVVIILWLSGKLRMAKLFFISVVSGEFLYSTIKLLFNRPRPDISFSLIPRSGYAFPSGHATMSIIFYGMLGFLVWHLAKKRWQKTLITLSVLVIVFLVGSSRVYLGVHWTSDVLAGWSLGFSALILFIAIYKERERSYLKEEKRLLDRKTIMVLAITLIFLEMIFIYYFYYKNPLQIPDRQNQLQTQKN